MSRPTRQILEKNDEESTYLPPADGLRICFLCKSGRIANKPSDQPGPGATHAMCHFIWCNILKGNAARLHSGTRGDHRKGRAEVPSLIGLRLSKFEFWSVFGI